VGFICDSVLLGVAFGDPVLCQEIARHPLCVPETVAATANRDLGFGNPSLASDPDSCERPVLALVSGPRDLVHGPGGCRIFGIPLGAHAPRPGGPGGSPGGEAAAVSALRLRSVGDIGDGRLCDLWKQPRTLAVH